MIIADLLVPQGTDQVSESRMVGFEHRTSCVVECVWLPIVRDGDERWGNEGQ